MNAQYSIDRSNVRQKYLEYGSSLGRQLYTLCFYRQMWPTFLNSQDYYSLDDTRSLPQANYWEPTGNNYPYQVNQLPKSDYKLFVERRDSPGRFEEIGYALRKTGILNPNCLLRDVDVHCLSILNPNLTLLRNQAVYSFIGASSSDKPAISARINAEAENTKKAKEMVLVPENYWYHNEFLTWNGWAKLLAIRKDYEAKFKKKFDKTKPDEIYSDLKSRFLEDSSLAPYLLTIFSIQGRICKSLNDDVWNTYKTCKVEHKRDWYVRWAEEDLKKGYPPILADAQERRNRAGERYERIKISWAERLLNQETLPRNVVPIVFEEEESDSTVHSSDSSDSPAPSKVVRKRSRDSDLKARSKHSGESADSQTQAVALDLPKAPENVRKRKRVSDTKKRSVKKISGIGSSANGASSARQGSLQEGQQIEDIPANWRDIDPLEGLDDGPLDIEDFY